MFDDPCVEVFPSLRHAEHGSFTKRAPIQNLNTRPPHQFFGDEAFNEVTVQPIRDPSQGQRGDELVDFKLCKLWINVKMMEHIGLFVVVRSKHNEVDNMFECLWHREFKMGVHEQRDTRPTA